MSGCGSVLRIVAILLGAYFTGLSAYSLAVGETRDGSRLGFGWISWEDRPWTFSITTAFALAAAIAFVTLSAYCLYPTAFAELSEHGRFADNHEVSKDQMLGVVLVASSAFLVLATLSVEIFMRFRHSRFVDRQDRRTEELLEEVRARRAQRLLIRDD